MDLTQLGTAAAVVIIILREVFNFLKDKQDKKNTYPALLHQKHDKVCEDILDMTKDLHDWHNVNDKDGTKIWYVKSSLEDAMKELAKNIAAQTRVFERLIDKLDRE